MNVLKQAALLTAVSTSAPCIAQVRVNDPATWVTSADAPFDGVSANRTVVRLALKISKEGRVFGCKSEFVQPVARIPESICSLIKSRAIYDPVGDKNGKPLAATDVLTYALNRNIIILLNDFGGAKPILPGNWITNDNYPAEAVRLRLEGRVEFAFVITSEGRAKSCRVTVGSGHAILDSQTCMLIETNARLKAPFDQQGRPVETLGRASFLWAIQ